MTTTFPRIRTLGMLCAVTLTLAGGAVGAEDAPKPTINNLRHVEGQATVPLTADIPFVKRGNGPVTLVLIPGAAFDASVWDEFMARHTERYTMYAITPPGHGGTPAYPMPEDPESFESTPWSDALVDGVVRLIRRQGLEKPIIVGHHLMGDHYAMRLALDHPDLIGGVAVVSGSPARVMFDPKNPPKSAGEMFDVPREAQLERVNQQWVPFFRAVSREQFLANSYKAPALTKTSADKGARLERAIETVPLPVQVRYYLEYLTTNLTTRFAEFAVPVSVITPRKDLESILASIGAQAERNGQDPQKAREAMLDRMTARYGSREAAIEQITGDPHWEFLKSRSPRIVVEFIPDAAIFVMDDQPAAFDAALERLIQRSIAAR
ncbi:MAG TPA: hypothetical protein DEB06_06895 [Phycisphaerales bacterium]|nr:hypothetical protein [Phycisphaerales bacterium]